MQELIRFQTDRKLDTKTFDVLNESASILEELLEAHGLDVPKAKRPELKKAFAKFVDDVVGDGIATTPNGLVSNHDQVDAFTDIIVFATGAILKLGHDPIIAIQECGKEVNSRVGEMVDGKFEKDLSEAAQANWYKADYSQSVR